METWCFAAGSPYASSVPFQIILTPDVMLGKLLKLQLSQVVFSALFLILSTLFDIPMMCLLMLLQQ